ncbi:ADP-ribose glycohydrolase OARD1 isoform X2 [Betta splendens]|uniref:ADP-ribose glycohydrolase OARD1 isoform X2 n=1 Tax=Betta splendens TaxID=158456 RepID=A0A6P7LVV2_BETSP|nr:ADP-ribose glycohydrolase OARD1 isoform X2 [Betta splendens]
MSCEHKKAVPNGQMKPSGDSWRLNYVTGDLFSCSGDEALAHCISEDCRMGAGIAVKFRLKFGGMDELKEQKKQTGECAVLRRERRFVYYLITKKRASQKPTYDNLKLSLEDMKSHCLKNKVTRMSMPRIGCGLDRLQWKRVSEILEQCLGACGDGEVLSIQARATCTKGVHTHGSVLGSVLATPASLLSDVFWRSFYFCVHTLSDPCHHVLWEALPRHLAAESQVFFWEEKQSRTSLNIFFTVP